MSALDGWAVVVGSLVLQLGVPLVGNARCGGLVAQAGTTPVEDSLSARPARALVTYDNLTLPGDEKMGLLGYTLLYQASPHVSVGPAAYGALTGERGGFITLGLAGEITFDLSDRLGLRAGYLVGAGGGRGGFTLSGGGLQLRSHAALALQVSRVSIVGGVSRMDFPSGTITSTQGYFGVEYPFWALLADGWGSRRAGDGDSGEGGRSGEGDSTMPVDVSKSEFAAVFRHYRIPSGVLKDDGVSPKPSPMGLLGVEWRRYAKGGSFLKIEAEGNLAGGSTGYMQILVGMGHRFDLGGSTGIVLSGSLGVAGGGGVATGGGLLTDLSALLQHDLDNGLFLAAGGGWVQAATDDFTAGSITTMLGYAFQMPAVGGNTVSRGALEGFREQRLRLRAVHQTYKQAAPGWRSHHADSNVYPLGLKVDYFLFDRVFLTGQGIAAHSGNAGAYMEGLVGAGARVPLGGKLQFEVEALGGAAGGGGLQVGGGVVWKTTASLGMRFLGPFDVSVGYGRMGATGGPFRAHVLEATVGYRFSMYGR